MAVENRLLKLLNEFKGLDLQSSDLNRGSEYASDIMNADFKKTGAMTKRRGFKTQAASMGGFGLSTYANVDTTTGQIVEELICVDSDLHRQIEETLTITYSGAETAFINLYVKESESSFYLDVYEGTSLVLSQNCGYLVNDAAPVSITTVSNAINALANFSTVLSGSGSEPAATLPIQKNLEISSTGTAISFFVWEQIPNPVNAPSPFTTAQTKTGESDFENATFANINNILYIATGYDELYKYDGETCYRAGLPTPATTPTLAQVAGVITDTNIRYIYTYEFTDAKGNIIESIPSGESATISPAAKNVNVTVSNIQDTTGFNTDSTDLKINLYRTTASGNQFYFVKAVVNDGTTATQVITDNVTTANLGFEYVTPVKQHGLPPKCKYATTIQGVLVLAGDPTNVDTVYYSDIESPEYFPAGDNSFIVNSSFGDKIVGLAPLGNELFIFKNKSIHSASGEINEDKFRVDLADRSYIGCAAHATITEVEGKLVFLANSGIYSIRSSSEGAKEESQLIAPLFKDLNRRYNYKKAVSVNWVKDDKYMVFLPIESVVSGDVSEASSNSICIVWDTFRDSWLKWNSFNMLGGATILNDELYFTERRKDTNTNSTVYYTYGSLRTGSNYDYADQIQPIEFTYKSNWEAMSEPTMFKKFLRIKVHSLDADINDFENPGFSLTFTTEKDYIPYTDTDTTLDFGSGYGGWGIDSWGAFPWGHARLLSQTTKLKTGKARSLRTIFNNDALYENVLISGYEYEVVTPYKPAIKE